MCQPPGCGEADSSALPGLRVQEGVLPRVRGSGDQPLCQPCLKSKTWLKPSAHALGELQVLGHDGDAIGVDGAVLGVLEEGDEEGLGRLLEGLECVGLDAPLLVFGLEELADEALEGEPLDEHVCVLLVPADLAQGHGAWPVALLALLARYCFPDCCGGERSAWGVPAGDLLRACHFSDFVALGCNLKPLHTCLFAIDSSYLTLHTSHLTLHIDAVLYSWEAI
jgi:hypothetical protein